MNVTKLSVLFFLVIIQITVAMECDTKADCNYYCRKQCDGVARERCKGGNCLCQCSQLVPGKQSHNTLNYCI